MTALALALVLAIGNGPYIRSRTSGNPDDASSHCLWWQEGELRYQQSEAGYSKNGTDAEFSAVTASFASWQAVSESCGNLSLVEGDRVSSRDVGYDQTGKPNLNLVVFRERACQDVVPAGDACTQDFSCQNKYDCWPHPRDTIAVTTVTYDDRAGELVDADVELNAAFGFTFTAVSSPACPSGTASQSCVSTDIQNTMTHEIGHFLGLDHTLASGSVMNPTAPPGETSKRTIDNGTRSFICQVYPKGQPTRDCLIDQLSSDLGRPPGCGAALGAPVPLALSALALALRRRGRRS